MQRISIKWTPTACGHTQKYLRKQPEKKKKLKKALRLLSEQGPQYPSLGTHAMSGVKAAMIWHNEHISPATYELEVTEHLLNSKPGLPNTGHSTAPEWPKQQQRKEGSH